MWEFINKTSTKDKLNNLDASTLEKVKQDVIKDFNARFGENTRELISFELTVILCTK